MRIDHKKVHHKIKSLNRVRTYVYAGLSCLALLTALVKIQIDTTSYAYAGGTPIGYLDVITSSGAIEGWTYDVTNSSVSTQVFVYMDGPIGKGTLVGSTVANLVRSDVNRVMRVTGNHGFSWKIPAEYQKNQHSWYAYGAASSDLNTRALLTKSPKSFFNNAPIGYLDSVNDGMLRGWSYDPDNSTVTISVAIYMDGPLGTGTFVATTTANAVRSDVNKVMGVSGDHGFVWAIPAQYAAASHTWYVYGVDSVNTQVTNVLMRSGLSSAAVAGTPTPAKPTTPVPTATPVPTQPTPAQPTPKPVPTQPTPAQPQSVPTQPTPSTAVSKVPPRGYVDGFQTGGTIYGWAYDADAPASSIQVVIYRDGPMGTGIAMGTTTANVARDDVNRIMGIPGNHGYTWTIPAGYQTTQHAWYAYAIDVTGQGAPVKLYQSGKEYPLAAISISNTKGALDNVSVGWVEGYACDPTNTRPVSVEVYASHVPASAYKKTYNGTTLYRIATANATAWEPGHAGQCNGNKQAGFHIVTPSTLLDRADHTVVVYAVDSSGTSKALDGAVTFNSRVLYKQEPILNIDDHVVVNYNFINSGMPPEEKPFFSKNHTMFLTYTDTKKNTSLPFKNPVNCTVGWATGLFAPDPANQQRGPSTFTGSCPSIGSPMTVIQAVGNAVGLVINSFDFGQWNSGMNVQQNWKEPQPVFRAGHPQDTIKVSGVFKQPITFPALDAALTNPDGGANWYFTLTFNPPAPSKQLWFTVPVFDSRKRLHYPWSLTSDGVTQAVFYKELGDTSGTNVYIHAPLVPSSTFITPCANSSYFSREPFSTEKTFCFTVNAAQFKTMLEELNQKEKLSVDTDPSHYPLGFFLVDVEVWGIGDGPNKLGSTAMALSIRDLRVESLFDGK